jgi:hypothetical protein
MTIDLEELDKLITEADKIFLTPEGENVLLKLLEIKQQVEEAIDAAGKKLEEAGLKANPNFTSIQADKVKVYYRAWGTKYFIDETMAEQVPVELYQKEIKTIYKVDSDKVDDWTQQHGGLPVGIKEGQRDKKITFSLKAAGKAEKQDGTSK